MGGRIFVSYARKDRQWLEAFRQMLGPALARYRVELWADDRIRPGAEWQREIGARLSDCRLGLLLVTAAYLNSAFCWQVEVPALEAAGVPIVWVLVTDCLWEDNALLRRLQGAQDPSHDRPLGSHPNQDAELARICRRIRDEHLAGLTSMGFPAADGGVLASASAAVTLTPGRQGVLRGAPPPRPSAFVARPEVLQQVRDQLRVAATVGVTGSGTLGLWGVGGIGKTVLASEAARDGEIRSLFPDGVYWLTLGERPDLVAAQRQLVGWLGGDSEAVRSTVSGTKVVDDLLADRQCLVILDDVWSLGVAQALGAVGRRSRRLITTRNRHIVQGLGAATIALDSLDDAGARNLLGQLTQLSPNELPPAADTVLEATQRVALAVALVGAAIGRGGQSWAAAAAGLTAGGEVFGDHPYADVYKALDVATASLDDEERAGYEAMGCFPEDTIVPVGTIGRLWGLDDDARDRRLARLAALSLVRLGAAGVAFHDLQRDYLLLHAQAVAAAHEQLLAAHQTVVGDWAELEDDDGYLWDHLTYHLAAAGRYQELIATVADPAWLAARIGRSGTLAAEEDLAKGLRWEAANRRLQDLLRRIGQTAPLLDRAARFGSVTTSLEVVLSPLRSEVDLSRLSPGVGSTPPVAWVAESTDRRLLRTIGGGDHEMVNSVVWSPDGARLATASNDGTARIWDPTTGAQLRTVSHNDWVRSVACSPDGIRLATASNDGTARIWDAITGARLTTLDGHTGPVNSVAWSPDGARLATASDDRTCRIWDAAAGEELITLEGHTDRVRAVAWSPDGIRLATASDDRTCRIWDAVTGARLTALNGHSGPVNSVAWSSDGARLATASNDGTARIWDAVTGAQLAALNGHTDWVNSVAWSPDGTRLATASDDRTCRIWDAAAGEEPITLEGHTDWVRSVAWSPDGTRLATASNDRTCRIWDAAAGKELMKLVGHADWVRSVAWSPDGTRLATASNDRTCRIWDAAAASKTILTGHTGPVRSVAWSPDGTRLSTASNDGTIRTWDPKTSLELFRVVVGSEPQAIDYSRAGALGVGSDSSIIVFAPYLPGESGRNLSLESAKPRDTF